MSWDGKTKPVLVKLTKRAKWGGWLYRNTDGTYYVLLGNGQKIRVHEGEYRIIETAPPAS